MTMTKTMPVAESTRGSSSADEGEGGGGGAIWTASQQTARWEMTGKKRQNANHSEHDEEAIPLLANAHGASQEQAPKGGVKVLLDKRDFLRDVIRDESEESTCSKFWRCACNNSVLALIWAIYFFANGAWIGWNPRSALKQSTGAEIDEEGEKLITFFVRAIGFFMMNDGATASLAVAGIVPVECAIGVGLLFRILHFLRELFHETVSAVGIEDDGTLTIEAIIILAGTVPLLRGEWYPSTVAKCITVFLGVVAVIRFLDPIWAAKVELGVDLGAEGMERTKEFFRDVGMEDLVGAILMGALAFGSDPVRAVGYASVVWPAYIVYVAFISPQARALMGFDVSSMVFYFVFAGFFAVKFLLLS